VLQLVRFATYAYTNYTLSAKRCTAVTRAWGSRRQRQAITTHAVVAKSRVHWSEPTRAMPTESVHAVEVRDISRVFAEVEVSVRHAVSPFGYLGGLAGGELSNST